MDGSRARRTIIVAGTALALAACGHGPDPDAKYVGGDLNAVPANYKADILAGMHTYLNDPTGIRSAAVAQPVEKEIGGVTRYIVCLQFNPKKNATEYAGVKTVAAVFLAGRLDHFVERPNLKEECAGATYAPFPELQKLPP
jgi:hypothetical protein